jgi:hypothetical protein
MVKSIFNSIAEGALVSGDSAPFR